LTVLRASGRWWVHPRNQELAAFFEALAADNLDIGRPENMQIIFSRQVRCVTKGRLPHRRRP
jgi:hypothetical protein